MAFQNRLTASAIRFYEKKGLVRATRSRGRRWFGPDDQKKLTIIGCLRRSGFSLREIEGLLSRSEDGKSGWRAAALATRNRIEREIDARRAILLEMDVGRTCDCSDPLSCNTTDSLLADKR